MRRRRNILISLLTIVPLGFLLKFYAGPQRWWLNNWAAAFAYEVFWMFAMFLVVPRRSWIIKIALTVCLVTCALEFLQLSHTPVLERARSTFIGKTILGHQFSWLDFPAYPIGCAIGSLVLHRLARRR